MVNAEEFKKRIEELVSQEYKIEFLGDNFVHVINLINETKADKIYRWVAEVINKNIQPISIASNKPYKNWKIRELLVFRHPFNIDNIEYRILLVKVKNSVFIEFHIGTHKYYDGIRKELELKRG